MGDNFSISKWNKERFLKEDSPTTSISPKLYFRIWEFLTKKLGDSFTNEFPSASDFYFKIENHLVDVGMLNETKNKKYIVEYWKYYDDNYEPWTIDIEAPDEETALKIARKKAPRGSRKFKIIN